MIPYFVFDHITIGPITFYTWGFFVGLAFATSYFLTLYRAKKKNIPPEKIFWLALVIFFGTAIGSRAAYLLQFPRDWLADISLLWQFNQGGLMLWGGIFGAALFGGFYARWAKLGFWRMADLVAPAIALGIGIGRIGCFLINDHVGAPTNLPWGILWPDGISRHPVALYESLVGFGLFTILMIIQNKLSLRGAERRSNPEILQPSTGLPRPATAGLAMTDGSLFLLFLSSYAAIRFLLDFFRASDGIFSDPHWLGLASSQWISLAVFLVAMLFFVSNKKKRESHII